MKSETYTYPAIFDYAGDGINVRFVDIPEAYTCGHNDEEAVLNAEDVLAITLYERQQTGKPIPPPTPARDIAVGPNAVIMLIHTNLALARIGIDNKAVNTTLTLPKWLKDVAVAKGISLSQTLQDALIGILGLEEPMKRGRSKPA